MTKARCYFAHPINAYGTNVQRDAMDALRLLLGPAWTIVNPDTPEHDAAYKEWAAKHGNGMGYFTHDVIPTCQALAFLAFGDGMISGGASLEITRAAYRDLDLPVWEVKWCAGEWRVECIGGGVGHPWVGSLEKRFLSKKETIARVRNAINGGLLPYE
jgi:hypothetical protein